MVAPGVTFRPGRLLGIVAPGTALVVDAPAEWSMLAPIWHLVLDDAPVEEILDLLLRDGIRSLPPFVLARQEDGGARLVVRGGLRVVVHTAGAARTLDGVAPSTWSEHLVADALRLDLGEVSGVADSPFRVATGIVLLGGLTMICSDEEPEVTAPPRSPSFLRSGEPESGGEEVEAASVVDLDPAPDSPVGTDLDPTPGTEPDETGSRPSAPVWFTGGSPASSPFPAVSPFPPAPPVLPAGEDEGPAASPAFPVPASSPVPPPPPPPSNDTTDSGVGRRGIAAAFRNRGNKAKARENDDVPSVPGPRDHASGGFPPMPGPSPLTVRNPADPSSVDPAPSAGGESGPSGHAPESRFGAESGPGAESGFTAGSRFGPEPGFGSDGGFGPGPGSATGSAPGGAGGPAPASESARPLLPWNSPTPPAPPNTVPEPQEAAPETVDLREPAPARTRGLPSRWNTGSLRIVGLLRGRTEAAPAPLAPPNPSDARHPGEVVPVPWTQPGEAAPEAAPPSSWAPPVGPPVPLPPPPLDRPLPDRAPQDRAPQDRGSFDGAPFPRAPLDRPSPDRSVTGWPGGIVDTRSGTLTPYVEESAEASVEPGTEDEAEAAREAERAGERERDADGPVEAEVSPEGDAEVLDLTESRSEPTGDVSEAEAADVESGEAGLVAAEGVETEQAEGEPAVAEQAEVEPAGAELGEAERAEAERVEAERVEAERVEAERAEAERVEAERVEAERAEAERAEAERLAAEQAEAERIEAERAEAERIENERLEAERQEAERIENERLEAERIEAERREAELVAAEKAEAQRLEDERIAAERREAERIENERLEAERLENERLETERREAERLEEERLEAERAEAERVEAERLEVERVEAERVEAERREAERVEEERREAERREWAESHRLEAERIEAERLADEARFADDLDPEELARLADEARFADELPAADADLSAGTEGVDAAGENAPGTGTPASDPAGPVFPGLPALGARTPEALQPPDGVGSPLPPPLVPPFAPPTRGGVLPPPRSGGKAGVPVLPPLPGVGGAAGNAAAGDPARLLPPSPNAPSRPGQPGQPSSPSNGLPQLGQPHADPAAESNSGDGSNPGDSNPGDSAYADSNLAEPPYAEPPYHESPYGEPNTGSEPEAPAGADFAGHEPPREDGMVEAVLCTGSHPNPPGTTTCRRCGRPVPPQSMATVPQPTLGVLKFTSGERIHLDHPLVLGRDPKPSPETTVEAELVTVKSPTGQVSRTHAEVRLDGWEVALIDLGATNGTRVTPPGGIPALLSPGVPVVITPGTHVELGGEVQFVYSVEP